MPEPLTKGRTYDVTFEYAGGEILQSRNGYIPPSRIWYPTPVGGVSRATYDLTFRVPKSSLLVASGKPVRQSHEGAWDVSQWTSGVPMHAGRIPLAGTRRLQDGDGANDRNTDVGIYGGQWRARFSAAIFR